jgi:hypothetical protein
VTIDASAVGTRVGPVTLRWRSKDCLLYALGIA